MTMWILLKFHGIKGQMLAINHSIFPPYYAVKDRIDFSHLSTPPDVSTLSKRELCQSMLPSDDDDMEIRSNISYLVARVLCEHVPYFQHTYDGVLERHIKHRYYKQMSLKSEVVC